jgi:hypothetical protein
MENFDRATPPSALLLWSYLREMRKFKKKKHEAVALSHQYFWVVISDNVQGDKKDRRRRFSSAHAALLI